MGKISAPLMDRIDLRVEVPPVSFADLDLPSAGESSASIAARVASARNRQSQRYREAPEVTVNADIEGALLEEVARPSPEGKDLLLRAAEKFKLSARGYHRILRVARTIADLEGHESIERHHIAEALSYRLTLANR